MDTSFKIKLFARGLAAATIAGVWLASTGNRHKLNSYRWRFNPKTVEEISGRVMDVSYSEGGNKENEEIDLNLNTGQEILTVGLGPGWFLENQPVRFKPGDKITVRGSRYQYKNQACMVAESIKRGSHTLRLRNEVGRPFWSAWE